MRMTTSVEIAAAGLFNAAVLFLAAAGLQLIFGVQRVVNLACGAIYALGAYVAASAANRWGAGAGFLLLLLLIGPAIAVGAVGLILERAIRLVRGRDEAFQLLLTFAFVLMFQDVLRFGWGAQPLLLAYPPAYGRVTIIGADIPVYNILIILISITVAIGLAFIIERTRIGHVLRATSENRDMAEGLGVDSRRVDALTFMLGSMLGAVGGALVVSTSAASLDAPIDLIVEAFAIVAIGGLGSIAGAFVGSLIVGLVRALAIYFYAESEIIAIYMVVLAVLVIRPCGLFGKA
jgi:branched-chain amino acid transport system permease protein